MRVTEVKAMWLAPWDLKGKLLGQPVYALPGGPVHDDLSCYATGNDTDWYVELGFEANKRWRTSTACPMVCAAWMPPSATSPPRGKRWVLSAS